MDNLNCANSANVIIKPKAESSHLEEIRTHSLRNAALLLLLILFGSIICLAFVYFNFPNLERYVNYIQCFSYIQY